MSFVKYLPNIHEHKICKFCWKKKKSCSYAGYSRVLTILPLDMKFGYKLNKKCDNLDPQNFLGRKCLKCVSMVENLIYCLYITALILCKINVIYMSGAIHIIYTTLCTNMKIPHLR